METTKSEVAVTLKVAGDFLVIFSEKGLFVYYDL